MVLNQAHLTKEDKNELLRLHNLASDDTMYGENLYAKLEKVVEDPQQIAEIFLASVRWPKNVQIDYI